MERNGKRWFHSKKYLLAVIAMLALCGLGAAAATNPAGTTRCIARFDDSWQQHWPFPRGHYLFSRFHGFLYSLGVLRPVRVEVQPGTIMELDTRDLVTRRILLDGTWEPQTVQALRGALKPGAVFIDVGAHVGYYALLASNRVGSSGKVIAVEPNPATAERLRRNLALSNAANVVVQQVACTDVERTLDFFGANSLNTGQSSLSEKNAGAKSDHITVRGLPLDRIISTEGIGRIDLVKIDVEGAELAVLSGMKESLAAYKPKLVLELRDDNLKNFGTTVAQVSGLLNKSGYARDRQLDGDNSLWVPVQPN